MIKNSKSDNYLAKQIKNDNNQEALNELVCRHSGIYMDMIKKFGYGCLSWDQISDIVSEKEYNIYKAAIDYDEERAKFSTHLANKTKYICLTQKTKNKKNKENINLENVEYFDLTQYNHQDTYEKEEEILNRIINILSSHKDKRVSRIFYERYFNNKTNKPKTWCEIGNILGMSAQGCINIHNKTIEQLKNKIKNDGIKL